jgi:hypothetical protein
MFLTSDLVAILLSKRLPHKTIARVIVRGENTFDLVFLVPKPMPLQPQVLLNIYRSAMVV